MERARKRQITSAAPRWALAAFGAAALWGCAATYNPMQAPSLPSQWYAGATAGYGVNMIGGDFHSQSPNPDCNGFTGGSGSGISIGLAAGYLFKQQAEASSGVLLRLAYEQKPGTFTADYGAAPFFDPSTQQRQFVAEKDVADITYNVLDARLMYVYAVPSTKIGVELGPSLGIVSAVNVNQSLQIDQGVSPGVTFGGGGTDSVLYNQSPGAKNAVRFGLWAGADYRFDAGDWIVSPFLGYDLGLTKTLSTQSWSVSSIIAGVDVKYGLK